METAFVSSMISISITRTILGFALAAQTVAIPAKWIGTWTLDVQKSTFGEILVPGVPPGLTIVRQSLKLEQGAGKMKLSGDTVMSDGTDSFPGHDDMSLSLDGAASVVGPVSLSFKRIDGSSFDIVSKLNMKDRNLGEVSHFAFSSDGKTLTETKTQTERDAAGAVIKTSTFVLVFAKTLPRDR